MSYAVGLIGTPWGTASLPHFQQAAFDAIGLDARYEAWDLPPEEVEEFIRGLRTPDALGANVTIPYRRRPCATWTACTRPPASSARSTRSSTRRPPRGFNTDVAGFQAALKDVGFDARGVNAVVWGAGGAARAVAWALVWRKATSITIVNRTAVRAARLRHDVPRRSPAATPAACACGPAAPTTPPPSARCRSATSSCIAPPWHARLGGARRDAFPSTRSTRRRWWWTWSPTRCRRRSCGSPPAPATASSAAGHARAPGRGLLRAVDPPRAPHGRHDRRRAPRDGGGFVSVTAGAKHDESPAEGRSHE